MNIYKLARTTLATRALIAARRTAGVGEAVVAGRLGIDRKTVRKWPRRHRMEEASGLSDRTSRPWHATGLAIPEIKEKGKRPRVK